MHYAIISSSLFMALLPTSVSYGQTEQVLVCTCSIARNEKDFGQKALSRSLIEVH